MTLGVERDQSSPIFFDLDIHNIFAEQYVIIYDRLRKEYPWWSSNILMQQATSSTKEYLHLKLKDELKNKPIWPPGFAQGGS